MVARRCAIAWISALAVSAASLPVSAETAPRAEASAPDPDPRLRQARQLFREGVELLEAGDVERALEYFLRSRERFASSQNTTNAAICLERLGRSDEALELYEELLVRFAGDLDAEDRAAVGPSMARLRERVGSLVVDANVEGLAIVDGRPRGKLPRPTPIRVLGGRHTVRVVKQGYEAFETMVEVAVGEALTVEARLAPLVGMGMLRVEDPANTGTAVFVDGAEVGVAPWEGMVGAGRHVVRTEGERVGSVPVTATVVEGQTALIRVTSDTLGDAITLRSNARDARLALDETVLGTGSWSGRLPAGTYAVRATADGYRPRMETLTVGLGTGPAELDVTPSVDPSHPRWPKRPTGVVFAGAFGGLAAGSALNSDPERACPEACARQSAAMGFLVGARVGYRFNSGLGTEIAAGYLGVHKTLSRTVSQTFGRDSTDVAYDLDDRLSLGGPLFGVAASYGGKLGTSLFWSTRLTGAVMLLRSEHQTRGTARTALDTVEVGAAEPVVAQTTPALFVAPEIGAGAWLGPVATSLSLALGIVPLPGPSLDHGSLGPATNDCTIAGASAACAGNTSLLRDVQAHGPLVLWTPQISAQYDF